MRKILIAILVPCALVAAGTIGVVWWDRGAPPGFRPTLHDVDVLDVSRDHRGVRIKGTAHYTVRVRQTMGSGEVFTLFPLMEREDVMGRQIHVLVRSTRLPDELTTFEDLTVEGLARPPGRLVGHTVRDALEDGGYHFDDDYVLIESFDDE